MLPVLDENIDEISAYRNPEGSFQVNIELSSVNDKGNIEHYTIKIPKAQLNMTMVSKAFREMDYEITLKELI